MKVILAIAIALTITVIHCQTPTPPVWASRFQIDFVETFAKSPQTHIVGKIWYDWDRRTSRMDRTNGKFDSFCGSVTEAVTPCTQLVKNQQRYIIYPQLKQCCICCDAAHGCGVLRRDWLKEAKFQGKDQLSGQFFNKFSIPDGSSMDYYWSTTDAKALPRKMSEVESRYKDFIMNTYSEQYIADSVFALPSYCAGDLCTGTVCPLFRGETSKQSMLQTQ